MSAGQGSKAAPFQAPSITAPAPAGARRPPRVLRSVLALHDFEAAARRFLPHPLFAYVSGGCESDRSLRGNAEAFQQHAWVTRVLRNTSQRSLATTLFGHEWAAPFGIAPMGLSAWTAYRGDIVQARAAGAAGIPMVLSGTSLIRMEEVIQANPEAWFQAYVPGEVERIEKLLERVQRAGFGTLVVTVDTAVSGNRENNLRAGFSTPLRPSLSLAWQGVTHPRWLFGVALKTLLRHGMPHFENSQATRGAPILSSHVLRDFGARDHLDWDHLALIRRRWPGRMVVKGLLHPEDVVLARDHGADGVILSNHGGRQLDGAVSPLTVLPAAVQAVGTGFPLMIDGGIRRGNDVLVALALGAKFVFVGRPFNYAAGIAGEAGVAHAIGILGSEVLRNMALLGVSRVADLQRDMLIGA